ncbi:hypothetical protein [Burkholderia gladioli]|uniref:hypothetical protein n=1 Tax=Burkholderia gladioli TaxID=28095 RepID=UPI001641F1D8|nr:hypothetical protein [Burkholderia gladioli]
MNPISSYSKLAIAAVALGAIAGVVYAVNHWYSGRLAASYTAGQLAERVVWEQKDKVRADLAVGAIYDQSNAARASQARIDAANLKVEQDHAKALADLKAQRAVLDHDLAAFGGMRIDRNAACGSVASGGAQVPAGSEAGSAGGNDAWIASTVALPDATQRDLRALLDEADRVTETARAGQNFAVQQGFYPASAPAAAPSPVAASPAE